MYISEIVKCTNGKLINGNNIYVESFSIDSRTINDGEVFVSIKGDNFDGNNFIEEVLTKGAECVIFQNDLDENIIKKYADKVFIKVNDTTKALQDMAKYKRSLYNIPVVAITGSVGKTSTKDIIANVMAQKYNVLKTEGNLNNHIGLPLTLLKLKEHDAMCIEMGMNHKGELSILTDILKPTIAVITNVGTAHIGNLGSRENILKAKLEILEGLQTKNVVINNDNDLLNEWNKKNKEYNVTTYGIENESTYNAHNILLDINKSEFKVNINNELKKVVVNVPGNHFIYNSLCAISVGNLLNIESNDIIKGIDCFELTKKRMEEKIINNDIKLLIDCYNANFDSMKAALEVLGKYDNRKIAVLGDMLELGEYSKELHEKVGEELTKNNIDVLIAVGKNSKYIYDNSLNCSYKKLCENNEEAIIELKNIMKSNDVILFKASNSMNFINIVNELLKK